MVMKHLAPDVLTSLAERPPQEVAEPHLGECARCREAVDEMRAALALARLDEVPEPSPLFWEHFSAEVRDGVAARPDAKRWPWLDGLRASRPWFAGVVTAVVLFILIGVGLRIARPPGPAQTGAVGTGSVVEPAQRATSADEDADAWALVMDLAEDVDWDSAVAAGMGPAPGEADLAVAQLSEGERGELGRLISVELGRPSS